MAYTIVLWAYVYLHIGGIQSHDVVTQYGPTVSTMMTAISAYSQNNDNDYDEAKPMKSMTLYLTERQRNANIWTHPISGAELKRQRFVANNSGHLRLVSARVADQLVRWQRRRPSDSLDAQPRPL